MPGTLAQRSIEHHKNVRLAFAYALVAMTLGATTAKIVSSLAGRIPSIDLSPYFATRFQ